MNEYNGFGQHISIIVIELAQSGDQAAMEEIYTVFAKPCFSLAKRLTGNQTAAQDLVHSTFVKVMNNIRRFRHSGSFAGWIRQIAINESIAYLKDQATFSVGIERAENAEIDDYTNLPISRLDTKWWEACKDLEKLTDCLSNNARVVLFLHELEGYSHKEIGELFGKSESFSKQTLARAFSQLRKMHPNGEENNAS